MCSGPAVTTTSVGTASQTATHGAERQPLPPVGRGHACNLRPPGRLPIVSSRVNAGPGGREHLREHLPRSPHDHTIPADQVPEGTVTGVDRYAVGNNGAYFAVGRRCRHLRADLAQGTSIRTAAWSAPGTRPTTTSRTGRMVRGPQGIFAKVPGLDASFVALTRVWPLKRGRVGLEGSDLSID